jgi:hypothetical protein
LALERYDQVFLGCECGEHDETKPASSLQAMHDWLDEGGEVFATHAQAVWFKLGPSDLQSIAAWSSGPASGATGPFVVDTTPLARSLESWLVGLGAVDAGGYLPLDPSAVSTSVTAVAAATQTWIRDISTAGDDGGPTGDAGTPTGDAGTPTGDAAALMGDAGAPAGDAGGTLGNVKLFTAPIAGNGPDASPGPSCGNVVFSDIHPGGGQALTASGSDGSSAPASVPGACDGGPLTPGEEALEFLLFAQPLCNSPSVPNGLTK